MNSLWCQLTKAAGKVDHLACRFSLYRSPSLYCSLRPAPLNQHITKYDFVLRKEGEHVEEQGVRGCIPDLGMVPCPGTIDRFLGTIWGHPSVSRLLFGPYGATKAFQSQ